MSFWREKLRCSGLEEFQGANVQAYYLREIARTRKITLEDWMLDLFFLQGDNRIFNLQLT
jgi:hypothetical protein